MLIIDPGHRYELESVDEGGSQMLQFIQKEERDGELVTIENGTTTEDVLAALIDRTKFLDEKVPSAENKVAIEHLEAALRALEARTADRTEREVEGTNAE